MALQKSESKRRAILAWRVALPQCGYTYLNWATTAELSPPESGWPQVTTDPSARIAANTAARGDESVFICILGKTVGVPLKCQQTVEKESIWAMFFKYAYPITLGILSWLIICNDPHLIKQFGLITPYVDQSTGVVLLSVPHWEQNLPFLRPYGPPYHATPDDLEAPVSMMPRQPLSQLSSVRLPKRTAWTETSQNPSWRRSPLKGVWTMGINRDKTGTNGDKTTIIYDEIKWYLYTTINDVRVYIYISM